MFWGTGRRGPTESSVERKELRKAGRFLRTVSSKHKRFYPNTQKNVNCQENILDVLVTEFLCEKDINRSQTYKENKSIVSLA